jgi:8-oxo-dGTP diphosphatase
MTCVLAVMSVGSISLAALPKAGNVDATSFTMMTGGSVSRMNVNVTSDIIVYDRQYGRVLVVKRKNPPYQGQWALPGGYVDEGETFLQAAVRELKEETSLIVHPSRMSFVGVYDDPQRDPRGRAIGAAFITEWDGQRPVAADDALEVEWKSTAIELAFDHNKIVSDAMAFLYRKMD